MIKLTVHTEISKLSPNSPHLSDTLAQCMHCGLCLPACPTYGLTKREISSPRGRIRLVKGVLEDELPVSGTFAKEMGFCLGCYACMSACPAGVQYDKILDTGRRMLKPNPLSRGLLRFFFLKKSRLRLLGRLLFRKSSRDLLPAVLPAAGALRARVALFTGCVMDVLSADIHVASAQVLAQNGCEVHLLKDEECCGALLAHAGDHEGAELLARKNAAAFRAANVDAIVVNSAGCGAHLKKELQGHIPGPDLPVKSNAEPARASIRQFGISDVSPELPIYDIQEFLDRLGLSAPLKPLRAKVAVQEPCHLVHGQKVSGAVTNLLKKIPGITIVPLEGAKDCCGSAGIYNITHFRDSMKLLDAKMEKVAQTGADILIAANPGCLYQLRYGMRRKGLKTKVLHPMTLLAESYGL